MRLWTSCCGLVVLALLVRQSTSVGIVWGKPVCPDIPLESFENNMFKWTRYENRCYVYIYHRREYQDAQNYCKNRNASLVELNDEKENADISNYALLMADENNDTWIGINRISQQEWVFGTSGTSLTFTNWEDNEPSDGGDCAVFRKTDKWFTEECSQSKTFICEKPFEEKKEKKATDQETE